MNIQLLLIVFICTVEGLNDCKHITREGSRASAPNLVLQAKLDPSVLSEELKGLGPETVTEISEKVEEFVEDIEKDLEMVAKALEVLKDAADKVSEELDKLKDIHTLHLFDCQNYSSFDPSLTQDICATPTFPDPLDAYKFSKFR